VADGARALRPDPEGPGAEGCDREAEVRPHRRVGSADRHERLPVLWQRRPLVGILTANSSLDNATLAPPELTFEGRNDRAFLELRVRTALQSGQKRGVEFKLGLILDEGPPKPEQNWRLPAKTNATPAAPAGSNKERGK
jgi:hypothetical protein